MPYVILLHFDRPVNDDRPAQHYLEFAEDIDRRLRDHVAGDRTRTSGIMFACHERGIGFTVARVWKDGTRRDEYRLRQLGKNPKLCPICNPSLALATTKSAGVNGREVGEWYTERLIDPDRPRYGDLDQLKPYVYRPKHRTRSNGESNRTSGNASSWRKDTKAASNGTPAEAPADPPADTQLSMHPSLIGAFRKIEPPIDDNFAAYGFDDNLPY